MPGPFSGAPPARRFRILGRSHVVALAATGMAITGAIRIGRRLGPVGRRRGRIVLAVAMAGQEFAYHVWKVRNGKWSARQMLPLHVCSTLVWAAPAILLRPTRTGDEIAWYWGVSGAPQALATPDLGCYGFPHFRFWQFFVSHGLVLTVPLWQVLVEGRRPDAAGGVRAFALLSAHALGAYFVNRALGSNYLFVNGRPADPSLIDVLPPWPRYIPVLAAIAAGSMVVAWVPLGLLRRLEH